MSTYNKLTKHPLTKKWETATWVDDYYGSHKYGVCFASNPKVFYNPEVFKMPTKDTQVKSVVETWGKKDKHQERKDMPIFSGVLKYFPLALLEVSKVSKAGNDQHNPGSPLHWDRSKSTDEADALTRHLMESGTIDDDGIRHTAKMAWRALALLQKELESNK